MIIFTRHSLLKLQQRNISKALVLKALNAPDYQFPSSDGKKIAYKKFGKLYLKVVYRPKKKNIIVLTQHWEEKFKPIHRHHTMK